MDLNNKTEQEQQLLSDGNRLYHELEVQNWAPWIRFTPEELAEHRRVFPDGQVTVYDEVHNPKAALETVRIDWSGAVEDLSTWDLVSGRQESYRNIYNPQGNTISLLSMSVKPDAKKAGLASNVIRTLVERFSSDDIDYIIGDFRPSDFGNYKQQTGSLDFIKYINSRREDGHKIDGWLRSVERSGGKILKPDPRAMVVGATLEELTAYYLEHGPEKWWMVDTQSSEAKQLLAWHQPELDLQSVDEIWECGEAGTWYLDKLASRAVYIESNVWGQLTLESQKPAFVGLSSIVRVEGIEEPKTDRLHADYHLDEKTQYLFQQQIVDLVKDKYPHEGIYGAWIDSNHELSNLIRTLEASTPEFMGIEQFVDDSVEARSRFFALVDTRAGNNRIIHATRVSGEIFANEYLQENTAKKSEGTNFIVINELIESGQGLDADDFFRYYESIDIDVTSSVGVETNFTVGEKTDTGIPGIRVSDLGYIAVFLLLERKGLKPDMTYVFANVNGNTINSMTPLGFSFEPIAGKRELRCIGPNGDFTDKFKPVGIPISSEIVKLYESLRPFAAQELEITNK